MTWNRSAARRNVQPSLTTQAGKTFTPERSQRGVRVLHEGLLGRVQMSLSTPDLEALPHIKIIWLVSFLTSVVSTPVWTSSATSTPR